MIKKIKDNWLLFLILGLAIFLRVFRLNYLELFGDELDAGYQAFSLLKTGRDYKGNLLPAYLHSFSEWRAPGLMYSMVPFLALFGLNEWGVRLTPVFWGILNLFVFYKILSLFKVKKPVALMVIFVLAIMPWHVQYSRTAFELTMMSTLIMAGMIFLVKFLDEWKWKWGLLSAISLVLSFYTYNTANVYVPLLVLLILWIKKAKINWKMAGIWLGLCFLITLPLLKNIFMGEAASRFKLFSVFGHDELRREILKYRYMAGDSLWSKLFYNRYLLAIRRIVFNYLSAFGGKFLFFDGDITYRHSLRQVGNLPWVLCPMVLLGIYLAIKNKKPINKLMLAWLLVSPIPSCLTIDGYSHASRLFLMVFPLAYLAAVGLMWLWKKRRALFLFVLGLWFFSFGRFQFFYWKLYRVDSWRWWHTGYKELVSEVMKRENDYKKIMIENSYEPALIRYLFWSKTDPELIFGLDDSRDQFCIQDKVCFVRYPQDYMQNFEPEALYVLSQERNVEGDWDWQIDPPGEVNLLETIRAPNGWPLFYIVEKKI